MPVPGICCRTRARLKPVFPIGRAGFYDILTMTGHSLPPVNMRISPGVMNSRCTESGGTADKSQKKVLT